MMQALLLALTLGDADVATQVKARLVEAPVLTGHFEQEKRVKGFKRPLKSSGHFAVTKGKGVRWETVAPFVSTLTISRDDIVSKANGAEVFRLDAAKEPVVRSINAVLFALLAGDIAVLSEHFVVEGQVDAEAWRLVLTPKAKALAAVMTRIELRGGAFVTNVELSEASGDATRLVLSESKAAATAP